MLQEQQIVQKLLKDPQATDTPKKSGFPVWAGYLIGGVLIAIILFFGIGAIRRANRSQ